MKPALTPEEWAKVEIPPLPRDPRDHALAALCLYGQPFGFTHEDVELLVLVAARLRSHPMADVEDERARLAHLADRIAALLPPEN